MASPPWLDAAASYATCQMLTAAGTGLVGAGMATMVAGGTGIVPLSLGALSLLGAGVACNPIPVDGEDPIPGVDGCQELGADQYGHLQIKLRGEDWVDVYPSGNFSKADTCNKIVSIEVEYFPDVRPAEWRRTIVWRTTGSIGVYNASSYWSFSNYNDAVIAQNRIRPLPGQSCNFGTDTPTRYPDTFHNTIEYTDETTTCVYNITPQGFVQESDGGGAGFVMKIEAAPAGVRADGGIVGGCNFEPTLVYQPPGGQPPTTIPWDPEWPDWDGGGTPPWLSALIGGVGGAAVTAINNALAALFETKYPVGNREIYAACNYKENGDPETFSVNYPEENYQDRVLTSLDAIVDFQQQILLWRTPTCGSSTPKVGDYRTISFVSDEQSPNGKSRVAKRFRYRSSSGIGLDGVVDHWKDFTWSAGPVNVQHRGSQLGSPQVWAASIDEGKRVIQHAAAEAGIDPNQVGRWSVGGSDNPRYGVPGTMRVNTQGGYYWITSRLGPDQRPLVAET